MTDERLRAAKDVEWRADETEAHYLMRVNAAEIRAEERLFAKDDERWNQR